MKTLNFFRKPYLAYIMGFILLSVSCEKNIYEETKSLNPNKTEINKLIKSFDVTINKSFQLQNYNDNKKVIALFRNELEKNGINQDLLLTRNYSSFSNEFLSYLDRINTATEYTTKASYINMLNQLNDDIINSTIDDNEKQILINLTYFMSSFSDMLENIYNENTSNRNFYRNADCDGWWACWGKCAAGTIGGAMLGGLGGAAVGGAECTVVLPVIGTVACGAVGAVVGAVGGGLSGAASSC